MRKRKDYWNELLPYEKVAAIALQIIGAIVLPVLFCNILQLSGVIQTAVDFRIASDALLILFWGVYAVRLWREQRSLAITFIALVLLRAVGVFFIQIA